jgi:hypothetical protein
MYSNDPRDMAATLSLMHKEAVVKSNFDQNEAKNRFAQFLFYDKRFDGFDHGRLIERVNEARSNGRTLDLDDPWLQRGGVKRPGSW